MMLPEDIGVVIDAILHILPSLQLGLEGIVEVVDLMALVAQLGVLVDDGRDLQSVVYL
jgi:hypothetical protein